MIPYAEIIDSADRAWTFRLLDRLHAEGVTDGETADLVRALQAVSDPRSFAALEAILADPTKPQLVRDAAGAVLGGLHYGSADVAEDTLRRWWNEGDAVLRRHALSFMDATACPDIVLGVAADPTHEFHATAIDAMTFNFDRPEHLRLKIAALSHADPAVRRTAADVLYWDEPVAAEAPLIAATRDPVPEVAAEAARTLQYYFSVANVRCLHGLLGHADEDVRGQAELSFACVREELGYELRFRRPQVVRHLRRWLQPVWDILAFSADELETKPAHTAPPAQRPAETPPTVADLLSLLADPDSSPKVLQESLWRADWRGLSASDGDRLRGALAGHFDPIVRADLALAFEAWVDVDGLLSLLRDADFVVRKSAMYRLGQMPPTPAVADIAWEHLSRRDTLSVHATETLDTFVRHADPADAACRLGWIAGDHGRREILRVAAVHHLKDLKATEQVGQLVGLLSEPPAVTWALHTAILDAVVELMLPKPDIGRLAEVDNLFVQGAVAMVAE